MADVTETPPNHFIWWTWPLWGHSRPALTLALSLLVEHPSLCITMFHYSVNKERIEKEISRHPAERLLDRLHIVYGGENIKITLWNMPSHIGASAQSFIPLYQSLMEGTVFRDPISDAEYRHFSSKPCVIIFDQMMPFISGMLESVRNQLPKLQFNAYPGANIMREWGTSSNPGIYMDALQEIPKRKALIKEQTRKEVTDDEAFLDWYTKDERLINRIGAPPMYAYEYTSHTDAYPLLENWWTLTVPMISAFETSQGQIVPWPAELEPGMIESVQSLGKNILMVGPQLPDDFFEIDDSKAQEHRWEVEKDSVHVKEFLDKALAKYGKNSVLYISFGSLCYPIGRPDQVITFLKTLTNQKTPVPFVFTKGSEEFTLTPEIEAILRDSESILVDWAPQQAILKHEATGYMLTHCGQNTAQEVLLAGVVPICWPLFYDQQGIAAQISQVFNAGYELVQMRTGYQKGRKMFRGGVVVGTDEAIQAELIDVFTRMRGPDGKLKRERVLYWGEVIRKSRKDGQAKKALQAFKKYFVKA